MDNEIHPLNTLNPPPCAQYDSYECFKLVPFILFEMHGNREY
jgi:hypothetical protein